MSTNPPLEASKKRQKTDESSSGGEFSSTDSLKCIPPNTDSDHSFDSPFEKPLSLRMPYVDNSFTDPYACPAPWDSGDERKRSISSKSSVHRSANPSADTMFDFSPLDPSSSISHLTSMHNSITNNSHLPDFSIPNSASSTPRSTTINTTATMMGAPSTPVRSYHDMRLTPERQMSLDGDASSESLSEKELSSGGGIISPRTRHRRHKLTARHHYTSNLRSRTPQQGESNLVGRCTSGGESPRELRHLTSTSPRIIGGGVIHRSVVRRSSLLPKAKNFQRILSQLEDESKPLEFEIKQERELVHMLKGDEAGMDEDINHNNEDNKGAVVPSSLLWTKFRDGENKEVGPKSNPEAELSDSMSSPTLSGLVSSKFKRKASEDRFDFYFGMKRRAVSPSLGSPILSGMPSPTTNSLYASSPTNRSSSGNGSSSTGKKTSLFSMQDASGSFSRMKL
ncbi:uncharacterized protein VTP21DRAFT_8294 [Calcarisporiella thermophila]|uniref:uncharacterized protein n=1 Tax=Calcarisporiella thermophila TaxID=911321 RepID=UPI003743C9E3